jgi:YedE family putative selenium metabolism protein
MRRLSGLLVSRWGPVLTGALVGILAAILVKLGNPGNMGICVACFSRDIAGALGLHRAEVVQYIRPEIIGFVLGAVIAALAFGEFRPRAGSAPLIRFLLGGFSVVGALIFMGCPWRAYLRLAGGDLNAIPGILGLIGGILLGAESTDARMMRLAKNEYVYGRYVGCEEVIAQIEKVSLDQLVAVAEEAFGKEGVSLVTLGPLEEKDLDVGCLQF